VFYVALKKKIGFMELSTFLLSEGWEANEELTIKIQYEGKEYFANIRGIFKRAT